MVIACLYQFCQGRWYRSNWYRDLLVKSFFAKLPLPCSCKNGHSVVQCFIWSSMFKVHWKSDSKNYFLSGHSHELMKTDQRTVQSWNLRDTCKNYKQTRHSDIRCCCILRIMHLKTHTPSKDIRPFLIMFGQGCQNSWNRLCILK